MEFEKDKCPVVDIQGEIEKGKQFDLEIILPEDGRDVIYGVVKDCRKDPVKDAVVKLIEVNYKKERKPVSHTFTDEYGQFVFGPLCPDREYEVQIWVNRVKHVKVCAKVDDDDKNCLKGIKLDKCDRPCEEKCEKEYENKKQIDYPCTQYPQKNNCCK